MAAGQIQSYVQKKRAGEQSALVMFYPYLLYGRYLPTLMQDGIWSLYPTRVFAMCSAAPKAAYNTRSLHETACVRTSAGKRSSFA